MSPRQDDAKEPTSTESNADPLQWILAKSEEAAAVAIGLTILGVNRMQVQRRDLVKAFNSRTSSDTSRSSGTNTTKTSTDSDQR